MVGVQLVRKEQDMVLPPLQDDYKKHLSNETLAERLFLFGIGQGCGLWTQSGNPLQDIKSKEGWP